MSCIIFCFSQSSQISHIQYKDKDNLQNKSLKTNFKRINNSNMIQTDLRIRLLLRCWSLEFVFIKVVLTFGFSFSEMLCDQVNKGNTKVKM